MKKKLCTTTVTSVGERKMSFTISTDVVDRDGDTIDPKGWELSNYRRSPVVLWAHDHSQLPIARATQVWSDSHGLHAQVEFPPEGLYPFADQVQAMVKAGFLNSTSVGFLSKESRPNRAGGQDIMKAELLEFSIVAVPANPHALVLQRSVNRSAVMKWLGQSDDTIDWDAINRSSESEIDWANIGLPEASAEVDVTTEDVERVVKAFAPVLRAGLREGLKVQARLAAEAAICRMTGRLD